MSVGVVVERTITQQPAVAKAIVDCDVHTYWANPTALRGYLAPEWLRYHQVFNGSKYHGDSYSRRTPLAARVDAWPPGGGNPGSDLIFMQLQHLDAYGIDFAVLGPLEQTGQRNGEYALALSEATNDWTRSEWLDRDARLRASILLPYEHPALAVKEIERVAKDKRFVQVYMMIMTNRPMGNRTYWPIFEAAEHYDLPVALHFGGHGGNARTGAGWPSFYLEDHVGNAQTFQAQLISLICEGVLERFPKLKVVFVESGVAWLPPLVWRLDNAVAQFKDELSHLKRLPSESIRESLWLTTQPIEEPPDPGDLRMLIEGLPGLGDRLMYSSDYPHWDYDAPDVALRQAHLGPALEAKLMHGNAAKLYGLQLLAP